MRPLDDKRRQLRLGLDAQLHLPEADLAAQPVAPDNGAVSERQRHALPGAPLLLLREDDCALGPAVVLGRQKHDHDGLRQRRLALWSSDRRSSGVAVLTNNTFSAALSGRAVNVSISHDARTHSSATPWRRAFTERDTMPSLTECRGGGVRRGV